MAPDSNRERERIALRKRGSARRAGHGEPHPSIHGHAELTDTEVVTADVSRAITLIFSRLIILCSCYLGSAVAIEMNPPAVASKCRGLPQDIVVVTVGYIAEIKGFFEGVFCVRLRPPKIPNSVHRFSLL